MNKRFGLVSASLMSLLLVAGCGGTDGNTTTNQSQALQKEEGKEYTVTISTWAGGGELEEMQQIVDKVNASEGKKDGYKIEIMSIPADYYTKVQAMVAAKSPDIDLMWLSQEYTPSYGQLGGLQDITEYTANDVQIDFSNMYEGALAAGQFEGKTYGIPWIVNPVIVYYNKTMTDASGYTDQDYTRWANGEWDLNEFAEIAKSMTKDSDGDGRLDEFGTYVWDWPPLSQWLWNFGGGYLDADGNIIVNSEESVKGWEYIVNLFKEDASALPSVGSSNNGLTSFFQSGKVGMILAGSSDGVEQEGLDFEIGYAVVPKGENGHHQTFPWIGVTSLNSFSDVPTDVLYEAASDLSLQFFNWKVASPIKGQEALYQELNPNKVNLPIEVMKKSLEISNPGNLYKYAEIGTSIWDGLDGLSGVQQAIFNATTQKDYKAALDALDLQKIADDNAQAFENIDGLVK